MRKIAIVDDEQEERDSLQECFEQFQKENAIKLEIKNLLFWRRIFAAI